jgi:predicted AlkP superfamily phosphohydrolase/phosphomutase
MIAILQFDAVNRRLFSSLLEQGRLPTIAGLRRRGAWHELETPVTRFEGATYFTLYGGKPVEDHGIYFPFMWSPADQRVRKQDDFPAPEPVWDRIGRAGMQSLIVDPYEGRAPRSMVGKGVSGWQFTHHVTLQSWSLPRGLSGHLSRRFGKPSAVVEVYGRPSRPDLTRMKHVLVEAPRRAADIAVELMRQDPFDLIWITMSAAHIAGHWFLNPSRLPEDVSANGTFDTALIDSYLAVEESMSRIVDALLPQADVIVLSPSGMEPNASRSHLLPGMLNAVLGAQPGESAAASRPAGSALWRLRAAVPTNIRGTVARVLPASWSLELTARLELRGTDWSRTRAFMIPSGDCGYVRLNLTGRERHGIVGPEEADELLDEIAKGLRTFRDPDGQPAVKSVERGADLIREDSRAHGFPDLIVHWSDRLPPHLAGVSSPRFGSVPSMGWGSGRTGEHQDGAWALVIPALSRPATPGKRPHIIDIAPTVCSVLGVDREGLPGEPLLEPSQGSPEPVGPPASGARLP